MLTGASFTGIIVTSAPGDPMGDVFVAAKPGGLRRRMQPGIEPSWAWSAGLTVRMG